MRSLRRRLTRLLLVGLIPACLALAGLTYIAVMHEVDEIETRQLYEVAQPYLNMSVPELRDTLDPVVGLDPQADDKPLSVLRWDAKGELLYRSPVAPAIAFASHPTNDPTVGDSSTVRLDGTQWRVMWHHDRKNGDWVVVLRDMTERNELAGGLAAGLLLPLLLSGLVLVFVVRWAVKRGLAPLQEIGAQVAQRQSGALSAIDAAQAPTEVQPLVSEINALLLRVEEALVMERQFTANASHELRTPLASSMAQIEVAQAATEPAQRDTALKQARLALLRASGLTDQLLALARLDHQQAANASLSMRSQWPGWQEQVDVAALIQDVMGDFALQAVRSQIHLSVDAPDVACQVPAQPEWLKLALRNLVGNALKFTPAGGDVNVKVCASEVGLDIEVQDTGPGVPESLLAQLGRRFVHGAHPASGSGLGLSIARRVAELHGGTLQFESAHGLKALLRLPR